jgi:YegS/Rv2252/BmrU family lipid kinase
VNEVASGFFEGGEPVPTRSRMGVLPLGTGGDFRRTFGIPRDVDQAAGALARGRCRRIDAGRISYRRRDGSPAVCHFVNIASAGIGGDVVHRVNSGFKLISGEITFTLASALVLLGWRNKPMRVVVDGELHELVAQQVVVANCQYYGGGMRVAPRAVPDDGLFDVVIAGDLGLLENARLLGPIRRGAHLEMDHDKITYRTARRVEIASSENVRIDVDGEQPGVLPATFEILPAAIDLVVP